MSSVLPLTAEDFEPEPDPTPDIVAARQILLAPTNTRNVSIWVLLGFVVFVMTSGARNISDLGALLVILLVHELGHLAGMKLFGFSDLKMFFIPFFGAAAAGRKLGASSAEHAIVLLLGPLPGIVIGTILIIASLVHPDPSLSRLGFGFVVVNAFNLLPVSPLDGGRLFERLVFNRHYWLELFFRVVTIVSLGGLAFLLQSWIFGMLGVFLLFSLPIHARRARAGFALVARRGYLTNHPDALSDTDIEDLLDGVDMAMEGTKGNEKNLQTLRNHALIEIYDRASTHMASAVATICCLACWAGGIVLSILGVILRAISMDPRFR